MKVSALAAGSGPQGDSPAAPPPPQAILQSSGKMWTSGDRMTCRAV